MIYLILANKVKNKKNYTILSFKSVNDLITFYGCVLEIMCDFIEILVEDNKGNVIFSKKCTDFNELKDAIDSIIEIERN